jgi:phosphate-selective porin
MPSCIPAGFFNGDGDDGSASGPEEDSPEVAARIVFSPFKRSLSSWLNGIQFGASATYANIDPLNIDLKVKSTGMVGTDTSLYVLTHNTKFGVIQDVDSRRRIGVEAAWAVGPVLFQGEYFSLTYSDLEASGDHPADAEFSTWYASAMWCLTGEHPILSKGVVKPIYPNHFFNPEAGTWGAFCLAARIEHFDGDENWINPASYVSVDRGGRIQRGNELGAFPHGPDCPRLHPHRSFQPDPGAGAARRIGRLYRLGECHHL